MAGKQRRQGEQDDRAVYYLVKNIAKRAGVEAHVHALRAASAVKYLEANPGRLLELKELMGHRNLATTQIYLRRLDRQRSMETVRPPVLGSAVLSYR